MVNCTIFKRGNWHLLSIAIFLLAYQITEANFATLAKNDPFPLYESIDPHTYLNLKWKLHYKEPEWANKKHSRFNLSISPFAQNADHGKTLSGLPETSAGQPATFAELGDLAGKTSLIALTYGAAPEGQTLITPLQNARTAIFVDGQTPPLVNADGTINDSRYIDPTENFGFVSFPLRYRKRGFALTFEGLFGAGFGGSVQTRVANISQVPRRPIFGTTTGLFPTNCTPQIDGCAVSTTLIDQFDNILDTLGLELEKCSRTSIEEIRLNLYWRWLIDPNEHNEDWPRVLVNPYVHGMISASPGKAIDPNHLFETPFGNNKHTAAGFKAGINFDFVETIEIGGEMGFAHFFSHHYDNFFLPNSEFQTNIYPFKTNVTIKPGVSWHFAGKISAYHFLERLSTWFQYVMLEHKCDHVMLRDCNVAETDTPYDFESYEDKTGFKVKLANIGFNYDITPNITIGMVWQAPLSQRNAYASSTLLFSFNATM